MDKDGPSKESLLRDIARLEATVQRCREKILGPGELLKLIDVLTEMVT